MYSKALTNISESLINSILALPIESQSINLFPFDIRFLSLTRLFIRNEISGISSVLSLFNLSGKLNLLTISFVFKSKFLVSSVLNKIWDNFAATDIPNAIASPCLSFSWYKPTTVINLINRIQSDFSYWINLNLEDYVL